MIITDPSEFIQTLESRPLPADSPCIPRAVLMVEPEGFTVNSESALDNRYMDLASGADQQLAKKQFRALVVLIRRTGTEVVVFPGNPETPDDVFPNNVFGTIPGRLCIGSMRHPIRQREAERTDIPDYFTRRGYEIADLRTKDCVAELTGVLVLDRARRIGFCGMSNRVDMAGVAAMHEAFDLRLAFCFDLTPDEYHTNVVFSVLAGRACVLFPGSTADSRVPAAIEAAFPDRTLLLDQREKDHFAGNCIALTDRNLFMSARAAEALRPQSRSKLESWGFEIHATELSELEKAGGSLRCLVAEIF